MKKSVAIIIVLFFFAVGGAIGFGFGRKYIDLKAPGFTENVTVLVKKDTPVDTVIARLSAKARYPKSVKRCVKRSGLTQDNLRKGKYTFTTVSSMNYAVNRLVIGAETPAKLTLSGTLRTKQRIAQRISRQMMVDSLTVLNALRSQKFCAHYGMDTLTIFAMILPDTYEMYWSSTVEQIFDRFKKEYDAYWTPERVALAKAQGLTPLEVSILASIVDQETNRKEDYPKMASVYLNRLHRGMKLQACPTVTYCYGYTLNRVLFRHLQVDSPFNTYKYAGLPPAPISVPPKACIEAVLHPDTTKYLFFCASPEFDGTHRFATTNAEHMRNSRDYNKAFAELQKKKKEQKAQ